MIEIKTDYKLEEHPDKSLEQLELLVNRKNQLRNEGKSEEEIEQIIAEETKED